jgi:hypothetical protein
MSIHENLGWTTSSTEATDLPPLGVGIVDPTTGKRYAPVYNAGAAAVAAAGDLVGLFLTTPAAGHVSQTAATQQVSSDGTTAVTIVAGVAVGAIAAGSYGYIQVGGFCTNITTDLSIVVGDPMYCADNAIVATTATSAHWHGMFGHGLSTDASTLLASANIDCALNNV